jgi:hypothetical protein
MKEFSNTISEPKGHGFDGATDGFGDYTINPNDYVRIIALDTNCRAGAAVSDGCFRQSQLDNFLIPELEKAKEEKKIVIVASHHKPDKLYEDAALSEVNGKIFKDTLLKYSNVVLHLVGHGHYNDINAVKGEDGSGYYEVQTSSLTDYPQQARIVEMVYEGQGLLYVYTTMIDHNSPENCMSYKSRALALEDLQLGNHRELTQGEPEDRNTILVVKIPNEVDEILKTANLSDKIESLTTLMK